MSLEWKRRVVIAGIIAAVYLGYRYLFPAVFPFLAAWILASWLYPAAYKIEKKIKIRRTAAGTFLLLLFLAAVGSLLYWVTGEMLRQIQEAAAYVPLIVQWLHTMMDQCCRMLEGIFGMPSAKTRGYVEMWAAEAGKQILSVCGPGAVTFLWNSARGMVFLISGMVVIVLCTLLFLGDMENIRKKIREYSWLLGIQRMVDRLRKTIVLYLKAQAVIIFVIASVCAAGFWILGSPYFLILGAALGILDAIPLIGTGTFLYPAAVIFLLQKNIKAAAGCVILDIITSFLREFLEPRLLGKQLGVSPVFVIFSVYAGLLLFGGAGVVLGPLACSTVYEAGKEWDVWD